MRSMQWRQQSNDRRAFSRLDLRQRVAIALAVVGVLGLALAFRLYRLDALPAAWYGDISAVHYKARQILSGQWPLHFVDAQGPLYHYLTAPILALLGSDYFAYKLSSVVFSLVVIAVTMLLALTIDGLALALLTGIVAAVSSALLIFSRLGDYLLIIPLLTVATVYYAARFARHNNLVDAGAGGVVAGLGLFAAPHTMLLPLLLPGLLLIYLEQPRRHTIRYVGLALLPILIAGLLFALLILPQQASFQAGGYLGSKLFGREAMEPAAFITTLGRNLLTTALMLHVRGDHVFRSNPPHLPHLDPVSGLFFLIGLLALLGRDSRRWAPLILLPIGLLVLPSSWPHIVPVEIPSASRTIGILPFVYYLVAFGLYRTSRFLGARLNRRVALAATIVTLAVIGAWNAQRYFVAYAWGLPYHNTAFGRMIADDMRSLPPNTPLYVIGCCWAAWNLPEVESIQFAVKDVPSFEFKPDAEAVCTAWDRRTTAYVYLNPNDGTAAQALSACAPGGAGEKTFTSYGDPVYLRYRLEATP